MEIKINENLEEHWVLYKDDKEVGVVKNYLQFLDVRKQIKQNKVTGYSFKIENNKDCKECFLLSNGYFKDGTTEEPFEIVTDLLLDLV